MVKMMLLLICLVVLTITPTFTLPAEDVVQELNDMSGIDPLNSPPVFSAQASLYGAMDEKAEEKKIDPHNSPPVMSEQASLHGTMDEIAEETIDPPNSPPASSEQEAKSFLLSAMQELAEAQFHLRYEMPVTGLTLGQSVEVVYRNPNSGVVAVNFVTDTGTVALHINPRYNWGGNINFLYLNTYFNGAWQQYQTAPGFPFPASGVSTRVSLRITIQQNSFLILANNIPITTFAYRHSLTPNKIRNIQWTVLDNTATKKAVLESLALHFFK